MCPFFHELCSVVLKNCFGILSCVHISNLLLFFFFSKTPISIVMASMCKSTHTSAIVANDKGQIEIHSFDYMHAYNFTLSK